MTQESMWETILPRRARPQPKPSIVEGGDCGPCSLAGMLNTTVESIYAMQEEDEPQALSWIPMTHILHEAERQGLIDRLVTDIPTWPQWRGSMTYGTPSWEVPQEWFGYVTMAIDAGYYGLCSVSYDKKGPLVETDHIVLICGVREVGIPHPTLKSTRIDPQLLVSCSSKHPEGEWCGVEEFLTTRGGYNIVLARPVTS